jgi:UTP-glucose-1-phosphate uridylyltransferase
MKISLVIMAAGLGSRFGQGIKQLEPVGLNNEIIMDYSIHDAIKAGFNKIIFIIRKDIEEEFNKAIGNRIKNICDRLDVEVCYAFQSLEDLPEGIILPDERKKPWGTGQAILACKNLVNEPFAVINADDYYGKEAFEKIYNFLKDYNTSESHKFCMSGFMLKNTLSDNGGVTRGVCKVDSDNFLKEIIETKNIIKKDNKAFSDDKEIDYNSNVSMNMWGFTPEFIELLEEGFKKFFENIKGEELTKEYLLPIYIGELLEKNKISVKVLKTNDKWFGITYKEDKDLVVNSFKNLIENGEYSSNLFEDLL